MKNLRVFLGLLIAMTIIGTVGSSSVFAQKKGKKAKPVVLKSVQAQATRGESADPNIKSEAKANSLNPNIAAPARKGGTTRGGETCDINIDNSTPLYIKIYIDGVYRGEMGPWDDATLSVAAGETRFYAKAGYSDGTSSSWGPMVADCSGSFEWKLTR